MALYISIWLLLLVLSGVYGKSILNNRPLSKIWLFSVFLLLVMIAGGRGLEVGVDTETYYSIYNHTKRFGLTYHIEIGWLYLNYFCSSLELDYNSFLTVVSALTLTPLIFVAKRYNYNPFFVLLIYYSLHIYTGSFNALRQYCALSYVLLAYYYISENKYIWTSIYVILAFLIHKSALISIPILLLVKYITFPSLTTYSLLLLTLYLLGHIVGDSFFSLFLMKYNGYVAEGLYRESSLLASCYSAGVAIFGVYLLSLLNKDDRENPWCKIFACSSLFLVLAFRLEYSTRIYVFLSISQLYFFPYLLSKAKPIISKTHLYYIIILYIFVLFMRMLLLNANGIIPYKNIWLNG